MLSCPAGPGTLGCDHSVVWLASTTAVSLICIVLQVGFMVSGRLKPPADATAQGKRRFMLAAVAFMSTAAMTFMLPNVVRAAASYTKTERAPRTARGCACVRERARVLCVRQPANCL